MKTLQIHSLDSPSSEAVDSRIRDRAGQLSRVCADVQKCDVWIHSPHGHHHKGNVYGIRIRLTVPGEEIDIARQPEEEDVNVAIRESFDAAQRKLEDYERRRRSQVKAHPRAKADPSLRRQIPSRNERP